MIDLGICAMHMAHFKVVRTDPEGTNYGRWTQAINQDTAIDAVRSWDNRWGMESDYSKHRVTSTIPVWSEALKTHDLDPSSYEVVLWHDGARKKIASGEAIACFRIRRNDSPMAIVARGGA